MKQNMTVGDLSLEIPISKQLVDLALSGRYEMVRDIVEGDAKTAASQALHDALHHHSGFDCGRINRLCSREPWTPYDEPATIIRDLEGTSVEFPGPTHVHWVPRKSRFRHSRIVHCDDCARTYCFVFDVELDVEHWESWKERTTTTLRTDWERAYRL